MTTDERCQRLACLPWLQACLYAVWVAPAVWVAVANVRLMLYQPGGAAPAVGLAVLISAAWIGVASWPPWRRRLAAIGAIVLDGTHFIPWLCLTILLALLGLPRVYGHLGAGLVVAAGLFTLTAMGTAYLANRRHFGFTLILLGGAVLLLAGLDRLVGIYVLPLRSHNNIYIAHDPWLGWKLRPNLTTARRYDGYVATETTNRFGFRTPERPVAKPAGTVRILVLGDSHTEAYTVGDHDTYTVLLERALAMAYPVEVIALGVAGFSTDQELLAYLQYGRHYQPDLVLLQFTSNDVRYNVLDRYWRGKKPRFMRYGDTLMLTGVPVPNLRNSGLFSPKLMQWSSLALYVESLLRQFGVKRRVEQEADPDEAWRVTELLIRDLKTVVQRDGAELLVFQADREQESETQLRRILSTHGIPYLETDAAYVDAWDSYWIHNHWNPKGQRAVASVLTTALWPYVQALAQP